MKKFLIRLILPFLSVASLSAAEPLILEEDFSSFQPGDRPAFFAPGGEIRAENDRNYLRRTDPGTVLPATSFRAGKLQDFRLRLKVRFPDAKAKEARLSVAFRIPGAWDKVEGHYTLILNPYAMLLKFTPKKSEMQFPVRKAIPAIPFSKPLVSDAWTVLELTVIGPRLAVVLENDAGERTDIYSGDLPDAPGSLSIRAEGCTDIGTYTITKPPTQ